MPKKTADPEPRLRKICRALPETTERLSHSMPIWFYKNKKTFVSLMKHGVFAPRPIASSPANADPELQKALYR